MSLTIEAVFAAPDHHFFAFEGDRAIFLGMDRASYHRSIFLDGRIARPNALAFELPVEALLAAVDGHAPPRISWIFHVAHCGSTLLARALDRPEGNLVLREPRPLRQLGVEWAGSPDRRAADWPARLRLASALAGRRYRAGAPTVVKANVPVNFIASDLLAGDPAAPAILLYFPLKAYLSAILRSPAHRTWVMNVTAQLEHRVAELAGPLTGLDVPERAAALWLAQMRLYAELIARFPGARSLNAEQLFEQPMKTLAGAASHLEVEIEEAVLDSIVAGPLFATYSKAPEIAFDNAARRALQTETAVRLAPEIDRAGRWLEPLLARAPLPARLDRPLAGQAPLLLDEA